MKGLLWEQQNWWKKSRKTSRCKVIQHRRRSHGDSTWDEHPGGAASLERIVGLFKHTFYKVIGGVMLTWSELSEVVLDVKTHLNCCPYRMWKMTSSQSLYWPRLPSYSKGLPVCLGDSSGERKIMICENGRSTSGPAKMPCGSAGRVNTWPLYNLV